MKTLYRSQFDTGNLFIIAQLYCLYFLLWMFCASLLFKIIVILLGIISTLYILIISFRRFLFCPNHIRIIYYLKIKNRIKIIDYKSITEVRYLDNTGYRPPTIVFVYQGQKFSRLFKSSNSFVHRRFAKRREILIFLHNKGIPIYIDTLNKKDMEIFGKAENVSYNMKWWS